MTTGTTIALIKALSKIKPGSVTGEMLSQELQRQLLHDSIANRIDNLIGGYTWYADTDEVVDNNGTVEIKEGVNLLSGDTKTKKVVHNVLQTVTRYDLMDEYLKNIKEYNQTVTVSFRIETDNIGVRDYALLLYYWNGSEYVNYEPSTGWLFSDTLNSEDGLQKDVAASFVLPTDIVYDSNYPMYISFYNMMVPTLYVSNVKFELGEVANPTYSTNIQGLCGSLSDCMTDEFRGTWFYVRTSNSEEGYSKYPEQYTIDGANGYLSLRDYVIWTGSRLVHIPTFEAKAASRNPDGMFASHSGVDGLMSSVDKAYVDFLIKHFVAACMGGGKNSGAGCEESGLYGNVTLGRPVGSGDGDIYNMLSVRDHVRGIVSQLLMNQNPDRQQAFFRGDHTKSWVRLLTENDLITQLGISDQNGAWPNWLIETGIYRINSWANGSAASLPPTAAENDPEGLWCIVTLPGADKYGEVKPTAHAKTQYAIRTDNRAVYTRSAPGYMGSGSMGSTAGEWREVMPGVAASVGDIATDAETDSMLSDIFGI